LPNFAKDFKYYFNMNKISILIVEDELNLLKAYSNYIALFCETIYTASNGEEALETYHKYQPNIILTDINMPKIDGIKFIEEIRKLDSETKIVILSAHTRTDNLLKAVQLNLVSYLVKPVKMEELKKIILQAIDELSLNSQIALADAYYWDTTSDSLKHKNEPIDLTSYEHAFVKCLIHKVGQDVSYEDIHYYVYQQEEYSLSAISSLVKRIRKKTTKELIKSCFKFGYRIDKHT